MGTTCIHFHFIFVYLLRFWFIGMHSGYISTKNRFVWVLSLCFFFVFRWSVQFAMIDWRYYKESCISAVLLNFNDLLDKLTSTDESIKQFMFFVSEARNVTTFVSYVHTVETKKLHNFGRLFWYVNLNVTQKLKVDVKIEGSEKLK